MSIYKPTEWKLGSTITADKLNNIQQQLSKISPFSDHLIDIYDINKLSTYKYGDYVINPEDHNLYRATRNFPNDFALNDSWEKIDNIGQALGIIDQHSKNAIESVSTYVNAIQNIPVLYYLNDQLDRQISATNQHLSITNENLKRANNEIQLLSQYIPGLYYVTDQLMRQVESINRELSQSTEQLNNQIKIINANKMSIDNYLNSTTTAVGALGVELAKLQSQLNTDIQTLDNKIKTKANSVDLQNMLLSLDGALTKIHEFDPIIQSVSLKLDMNTFSNFVSMYDIMMQQINQNINNISLYTRASEIGNLMTEIDSANRLAIKNNQDNNNNNLRLQAVYEALSNKMTQPTSTGVAGQVLSLDNNLFPIWIDPPASDSDTINTAVTDWLNSHPEATSTVADHSITLNKLSTDVQEALSHSSEISQLTNTVAANFSFIQSELRLDREAKERVIIENQYRELIKQYNHLFYDNDGFGWLFLTDSHNLGVNNSSIEMGGSYYKTLKDLHLINNIFTNTAASYVVHGGDWLTQAYTVGEGYHILAKIPNMVYDIFHDKMHLLVGNHEMLYGGASEWNANLSELQVARLWYHNDVSYYLLDNGNVRHFILDSGNIATSISTYRRTELEWFITNLLNNNKPHCFASVHIPFLSNEGDFPFTVTLTEIANAFNNRQSNYTLYNNTYDFSQCQGTFHFIMTGHIHYDRTYTSNNIPIICCRGWLRDPSSLDCCYANFDTATLHLIRIGGGTSRNISIIQNIT